MTSISTHDLRQSGDPNEYFMRRWSKLIAPEFIQWLVLPENLNRLDVDWGPSVR